MIDELWVSFPMEARGKSAAYIARTKSVAGFKKKTI